MKVTIGKAVIECDAAELPSILKHLNGAAEKPTPAPPVPRRAKRGERKKRLLKLLASRGAVGVTSRETAERLGMPFATAAASLKWLHKEGLAVQTLTKSERGTLVATYFRVEKKPTLAPPVVKNFVGPTEMLLNAILENKVPLPFGNDGVATLAKHIYGSDSRDARGKTRSLIEYQMKQGRLKRSGPGEFDLT